MENPSKNLVLGEAPESDEDEDMPNIMVSEISFIGLMNWNINQG